VHKPPVIVLDEPTAGVDVELRQTLWRFISRLNHEGHTVVLTTHYLEEAQALCHRIAMLKQGKVVALDSTAALIRRVSGSQLVVRLSGAPLPQELQLLQLQGSAGYTVFRVNEYTAVEPILSALRQAGCVIEDMQLQQADLEDVFLQIMGGSDK